MKEWEKVATAEASVAALAGRQSACFIQRVLES